MDPSLRMKQKSIVKQFHLILPKCILMGLFLEEMEREMMEIC